MNFKSDDDFDAVVKYSFESYQKDEQLGFRREY